MAVVPILMAYVRRARAHTVTTYHPGESRATVEGGGRSLPRKRELLAEERERSQPADGNGSGRKCAAVNKAAQTGTRPGSVRAARPRAPRSAPLQQKLCTHLDRILDLEETALWREGVDATVVLASCQKHDNGRASATLRPGSTRGGGRLGARCGRALWRQTHG